MSNIGKTTSDIKKKLSLGDYSKPAEQQDGKKLQQQPSTPVQQPTGKMASKPVVEPVHQQAIVSVKQQASAPKIKATYYLGKQEKEMITKMYINRLKQYGKADRSALICDAIRLLYEREK